MAGKGGEEQCTVSLNNHSQMRFDIAGESIFSQDIDDISKKWVKMIFLQPSTSYPDSYKIRNDKFGLLYKKLCAIQPDDGRMKIYQDQSLNKLMFFSEMRDLADVDEKNEFSVSLQEGKIFFNIYGISIYNQPVNESYKTIIQNGCEFFSLPGKSANELEKFIEKNIVSISKKIANYFLKHEKTLKKKDEKKGTDHEFLEMKYSGTNLTHKKKIYYFDMKRTYSERVICTPGEELKDEDQIEGTSKRLVQRNGRVVVFIPSRNLISRNWTDFDEGNNKYYRLLRETPTVISGLVVAKNKIVAPNAGEDLFDLLEKGTILKVSAFKDAAFDLKKLHNKDIYLTDIKIENMTLNKGSVNFIDINIVKKGMKYREVIFTGCNTTYGLVNNWDRKDPVTKEMVYDYSYLRTADNYALLLAMIVATTEDPLLQKAAMSPKVDIMHEIYPDDYPKDIYKHPGAINPESRSLFLAWICKNVKPEFHGIVKSLLTNPAEVAKNSPNCKDLADMLYFDDELKSEAKKNSFF
ncbi:hypothetical protein [Candidatus Fukatsuia endosymbiont of Tuberolachnus salignus]|uniref:hypothetical protein n=1 Tax=Candidatus Fukatsuia endosymbiont of Tuberolachnus salignus TaxID=3077957 RepID=UPI00313DC633